MYIGFATDAKLKIYSTIADKSLDEVLSIDGELMGAYHYISYKGWDN